MSKLLTEHRLVDFRMMEAPEFNYADVSCLSIMIARFPTFVIFQAITLIERHSTACQGLEITDLLFKLHFFINSDILLPLIA
jgi:hypothetical protein